MAEATVHGLAEEKAELTRRPGDDAAGRRIGALEVGMCSRNSW
jgi:hypothetical protein